MTLQLLHLLWLMLSRSTYRALCFDCQHDVHSIQDHNVFVAHNSNIYQLRHHLHLSNMFSIMAFHRCGSWSPSPVHGCIHLFLFEETDVCIVLVVWQKHIFAMLHMLWVCFVISWCLTGLTHAQAVFSLQKNHTPPLVGDTFGKRKSKKKSKPRKIFKKTS